MSDTVGQHVTSHAVEQEIKYEQSVVDRIYARLEAAAASAKQLAADGHARARLGNVGGLVERDAIVFQASRRLASLDAAHDGLVFGRLDMRGGERRYVGRLGLRDAHRDVVLVDWRAPAAAVFYQATAQDPAGVVRRRVISSFTGKVTGVEDDLLDSAAAPDDMVVVGEGALLAALTRIRDRSMQSVVATIQREQDEVIRSPQRGVTTIEGGPGTGKTVVALHRAAYLLYTDRRRYESGGVLVVGPNAVFIAYIERVLPSLGETSVSLRAIGEVLEGISARRHDRPSVAVVKGSARMRRLLARTAQGEVPDAPTSFRIFYRDDVLRLDRPRLAAVRRVLLAGGRRRNRAAAKVVGELIAALWEQAMGDRARDQGRDEFARAMRDSREFLDFVQAWWPVVDAVDVLAWLGDKQRLARDGSGLLSRQEVDELAAALGGNVLAGVLTVEDVPLVDELRYLLGEPPEVPDDDDDHPLPAQFDDETVPELTTLDEQLSGARTPDPRRPVGSIEDDGYAHVLVDEAQDLSPMQWRMLGRRGRHASWTVVGDAAQSAWPLSAEAAVAREEALRGKDHHAFRLSTNYRNSREIFELAADYARVVIPAADLPVAIRESGVEPRILEHSRAALPGAVRDATAELASELEGTVGVVVPTGWEPEVTGWLGPRDEERVRVLGALETKGLEFDGIVVVEPDRIVSESPSGARTLYVVLTRATQRLHVVGTTEDWRARP
ncbi:MAG: UvrD-helicase domain-containing protein [Nocardioidaceae bacterium]